jgi:hypothetical protein
VSGKADAEIRWYPSSKPPECFDCLVLPRGQPEFNRRKIQADLHDIPKMLKMLQISGIMPTEMTVAGSVNQGANCVHPARMGQAVKPPFHCSLHLEKYVPAAQGIAVVTNGFRELLQEETEPAAMRRKRVTMPRHFARLT